MLSQENKEICCHFFSFLTLIDLDRKAVCFIQIIAGSFFLIFSYFLYFLILL